MPDKEPKYKVGYKKPPRENQFKEGKSGNPKGRPLGSKNFSTILNKELNRNITIKEGVKVSNVSKLEAIVKKMVNQAVQGDSRSQENIIRYQTKLELELSPKQEIENAEDLLVRNNMINRIKKKMEGEGC